MKKVRQGWKIDFPLRDDVEDCSGKMRTFVITCHDNGVGFTLRAVEEGSKGSGYEFAAYSETTTGDALYRLRRKMHRALATRHITRSRGEYQMLHDKLSGRITSGDDGVVLVVDGIPLGIDDLASGVP